MSKLVCYAPGHGALVFCRQDADGKAVTHLEPVTKEEVLQYVRDNPDLSNRWIMEIRGQWQLVFPVYRYDRTHLIYDGRLIEYQITQKTSVEILDFNLNLVMYCPDDLDHVAWKPVENIGVRSAIRFYLNNEEKIVGLNEELPVKALRN